MDVSIDPLCRYVQGDNGTCGVYRQRGGVLQLKGYLGFNRLEFWSVTNQVVRGHGPQRSTVASGVRQRLLLCAQRHGSPLYYLVHRQNGCLVIGVGFERVIHARGSSRTSFVPTICQFPIFGVLPTTGAVRGHSLLVRALPVTSLRTAEEVPGLSHRRDFRLSAAVLEDRPSKVDPSGGKGDIFRLCTSTYDNVIESAKSTLSFFECSPSC